MNDPEKMAVAVAWYRRDQWALLRAVSVDADQLEETYDQWLAHASEEIRKLQAARIGAQKVDVEVGALTRWCESKGRPVDGAARAEYGLRSADPERQ